MKLTKAQVKQHEQACRLLEKDTLTYDEKWFVLEHWHEAAVYDNSRNGAFFTPPMLARDFALDVSGPRLVDLCAGIGTLSFIYYHCRCADQSQVKITCVESNPLYVEVGKKLLPEATWICGDIFEIWKNLGQFDGAIANPPFGRIQTHRTGPYYTGSLFEYKVIDIASQIADHGTFLVPQQSAGFRYSGASYYERRESEVYKKFSKDTGLYLDGGCGVDTSFHKDDWKTTKVICEIVCCDFTEREKYSCGLQGQFSFLPELEKMTA